MFKKIIITAILIGFAGNAYAEFYNGNQLYELCRSTNQIDNLAGATYVTGVTDMIQFMDENQTVCIPHGVTTRQLFDVVCESLNINAGNRHLPASEFTALTMFETYSC